MGSNKIKDNFEVVEVAKTTEQKIQDNETGEIYNLTQAVCKVWNEIKEMRKSIG